MKEIKPIKPISELPQICKFCGAERVNKWMDKYNPAEYRYECRTIIKRHSWGGEEHIIEDTPNTFSNGYDIQSYRCKCRVLEREINRQALLIDQYEKYMGQGIRRNDE